MFRQAATPAKRAGGAASPFSLKLHSDKFTNARSTAIRCVCNDNADRGHMIQCEVLLCRLLCPGCSKPGRVVNRLQSMPCMMSAAVRSIQPHPTLYKIRASV